MNLVLQRNRGCFCTITKIWKPMSSSSSRSSHDYVHIKEGTAVMKYNKAEAVFYNKVQVFNRDISIQVIRLFSEIRIREKEELYEKKMKRYQDCLLKSGSNDPNNKPPNDFLKQFSIKILDALAATGLRSIRYLKEIDNVSQVTINDLDPKATEQALQNATENNIESSKINIRTGDAIMYMYDVSRDPFRHYDVVDLDPYGSAAPFLDSAVQAVADGGLLCVTCTDTAILAGNYPEVCFAKYSAVSVKATYCHEMSLRILLHSIESAATKYKRHIVPWVSLSVDFYVRVFVRVFESPAEVKNSCLKRAMVHQSTQCSSFYIQPIASALSKHKDGNISGYAASRCVVPSACVETGGRLVVGGPFWSDPIHNQDIVDTLIRRIDGMTPSDHETRPAATASRMQGVLATISEELKDVMFYYELSELASTVHVKSPTMLEITSALQNAGYRTSKFHHTPSAIKTDAPPDVVWDVMRAYCKKNPPLGSTKKAQSSTAKLILEKEPKIEVDFTPRKERHDNNVKKIARFPSNPERFWGPKARAGKKNVTGNSVTNAFNEDMMKDDSPADYNKSETKRSRTE